MAATPTTIDNFANIPEELRQPARWLKWYYKPDPKKPDKKPGKHPCVKWAEPESRQANLRDLNHLLGNSTMFDGVQRWIDPAEGFAYIDLDHVRDAETGAVQPWAAELIESLDTYTEISASGTGLHLVCRGTLPEDFHLDAVPVEIYSGHINKLIALTGALYDPLSYRTIESRQEKLSALLRQCKTSGVFGPTTAETQPSGPPPSWRDAFHTVGELESAPARVFIRGFLEEGITFFGALSATGKTWIGLSISHALVSGEKLFGLFPVERKANVLYLIPEMGCGRFRERCVKMRLPQDGLFYCQTIKDGVCDLDSNPTLMAAVADMKPVVILDTAIRFQKGSENVSTDQAQGLAANLFKLLSGGAQAVICMHHRSKDTFEKEPTLENTLRGTGDFGAMADCVWNVAHAARPPYSRADSQSKTRLILTNVKPRDMEPLPPFVIQGKPYIDQRGDFVVLDSKDYDAPFSETKDDDRKVLDLISENPNITVRAIRKATKMGADRISRITEAAGLEQGENGVWISMENDSPM